MVTWKFVSEAGIHNLPSDPRSVVRFRHFGCLRVGTSPLVREIKNGLVKGAIGVVTGLRVNWLKFCMIAYMKVA